VGHKIENFFQLLKYAVSNVPGGAVTQLTVEAAGVTAGRVTPRDSVLLCDGVLLRPVPSPSSHGDGRQLALSFIIS